MDLKEDVEDNPHEMNQFKYYTAKLWEYATSFPPFYCEGKCKAPDGFFLGAPWMKTEEITARQGDKVSLICQIWNGLDGEASHNVTFAHNGSSIYEKTTLPGPGTDNAKTSFTDKWGEAVQFDEQRSPGTGHFSDFRMKIDSFEESMVGQISCNNGVESTNNVASLLLKVDGRWAEWGPWSTCSKSCVGEDKVPGQKTRSRECIPPQNGGNPCDGEAEDTEVCAGDDSSSVLALCPVDHILGEWSEYSECSPKCGNGSMFRVRTCTPGRNGGTDCPRGLENLAEKQVKACKVKDCPGCITLGWNDWTSCSKTCLKKGGQPGVRTRTRNTKEADPNNPKCIATDHIGKESCSTNGCPIDGKMTSWTKWAPTDDFCAKTCVDANRTSTQTRSRQCIEPQNRGAPCHSSLKTSEIRDCPGSKPCPIDCLWDQWGNWEKCSEACGPGGNKKRRRAKTVFDIGTCAIGPCHGGKPCEGHPIEEASCFEKLCPTCAKGDWGSWGACPPLCEGARRERTRRWVEPANAGQFTGLTLDCQAEGQLYDFQDCDGIQEIVNANTGATYSGVKSRCKDDPGATCFAKVLF